MSEVNWAEEFRSVYNRGSAAYGAGCRSASSMFNEEDCQFLTSIGATEQEIFDYVEDAYYGGDPAYEDVLAVTAIRYDFFKTQMGGSFPEQWVKEADLPRKTDSVDGISWLPRIIAKAKAKLRGELPPELMYGCGGDRPFLRRAGIKLQEFLELVRDAGDDDASIVAFYKSRANL